jgi:mannose-1-phosphate guanylyltransferase
LKALILAAGHGARLRPLTEKVPKCLLPVRGVPMLQLWLDLCAKHGITDVVVNAHANASQVRSFVQRYRGPVSVSVFEESELLGSAGTLRANRHKFENEPLFWVMYADVLTSANLDEMLACHLRTKTLATLGLYEVANPRACGIVTLDEVGIVREFAEKPLQPKGNLAFSGLMIGTPDVLNDIPAKPVCDIGFDLLPKLVGRMAGHRIREYLVDIGTLTVYEAAQRCWPGIDPIKSQERRSITGAAPC